MEIQDCRSKNSPAMANFVHFYDSVFSSEFCSNVIKKYSDWPDIERWVHYDGPGSREFGQLVISGHEAWRAIERDLLFTISDYEEIYKKDCGLEDVQWPSGRSVEKLFSSVRIKHYKNNSIDEFRSHTDLDSLEVCHRLLAYIVYLNDVDSGGQTEFPYFGFGIKPKAGRLLMFPPFWMYLHRGKMPLSGPKFILQGFLHYGEHPEPIVRGMMAAEKKQTSIRILEGTLNGRIFSQSL